MSAGKKRIRKGQKSKGKTAEKLRMNILILFWMYCFLYKKKRGGFCMRKEPCGSLCKDENGV